MPTLPWTTPKTLSSSGTHTDVVVMASRLELRSLRHVPAFLLAAMRIRRQMLASPGALGLSLIARPFGRTFWTLSAWESQAALNATIRTEPHWRTMKRFGPRMAGSVFVTWHTSPDALPIGWPDALHRLETEGAAA